MYFEENEKELTSQLLTSLHNKKTGQLIKTSAIG
jgi:hypothetical protein